MEEELVDFLSHQYEVNLSPFSGAVRSTHEPVLIEVNNVPENFDDMVKILGVDEMGVNWELNLNEYEGEFGSIISGSKSIKHGEKYKYRHEFVSETFKLGKTDERLENIQKLGDDDDIRTPDFILRRDPNIVHVIELATTRSTRMDLIQRSYDLKMFSYYSALENRSVGKSITYTCIIVSPNLILASVELPDLMAKELLARMRIALSLERRAEMINIDLEDDEKSEFRNTIKSSIKSEILSIKYRKNCDNPLLITEELMQIYTRKGNEKLVIDDLIKEIQSTRTEIINDLSIDYNSEIQDFKNKFKEGNRRSDRKPVSFFPFINTQEHPPSSDIPKKSIHPTEELLAVSKLWSVAMDAYEMNPNREEEDPYTLIEEALSEDIEVIKMHEANRIRKRRTYHRVDLRGVLKDKDLEELACQGLWAKKHSKDDFMVARRIHQQSYFRWNTYVGDIEEYLWDTSDLDLVKTLPDSKLSLILESNKILGNNTEALEQVNEWTKTSLYQSMDIISDIAYEVAISNKQHCKTKEMILKKLRKYQIYLLISPTKGTEHTFVSLYIPNPCKIKNIGVFGRAYKIFGGYITDFFSIKIGKLENQSSMPASLISLASFWSWFYNLKDISPNSFKEKPEALYMLKFSLLLRLEDKAQTEETVTMTRYMYMEIFKSHFAVTKPNPFKMLTKLTTRPRSRLNLFCIKKIINNFCVMLELPPKRLIPVQVPETEEGEDSVPNDQWENLINWVTGNPVYTASKAINLVYLGYLKNKMEPPEGNTDFQLVDKTLEEEFSLDKNEYSKSLGFSDDRPKGKQFKINNIQHGCDVMIKRLKTMLGKDWGMVIENDILETLTSRMTMEIATLKASSHIDHKSINEEATMSSNLGANRIKVIEAVSEHLAELGINPMTKISSIIKKIEETSRGVISDLFKKQQHGGLREIYVLTIESRIVQLYIETISRVLCSYFEEETLTHPRNKLKKLDEHRTNAARIASRDNCVYADFCCSTDKTRWNQNFVMPAMSIPLLKLTPTLFHNSIVRILNLWTCKLIKLPQRVVNLLIHSVEINSEVYKKLHSEFWKPSKDSIFDRKCGKFIRLTSGMMQGILHYTSSLLHLSFLNSMGSIIPSIMKSMFPNFSFLITQVCSSDDSATILTTFSPRGERDVTKDMFIACKKSTQILESLNTMANYYCMKNSIKTTTSLIDYVEFNSEFLFRNTIAIPIIKYVAASLNITESESFLERFHTMYNLISDLFSSGFPAYNTHVCQIAQAINHYKTMGSSTNPTFEFWADNIKELPDPVLGFFILDCDLCPGTLGYSYGLWKTSKKSNILKRSAKSMMGDANELIDSGGIMQSLILKHGEVKRWKSLVNSVSKGEDFSEQLEKDPEILFKQPRTVQELKTSLALKATMPSVAKSLRRGNPYLQSLSMSVYAINTHCFSKTTVTADLSGKVDRNYSKTSLLMELRRRQLELTDMAPISDEIFEITFPSQDRYIEADRIISTLRRYYLVKCAPFRHRRTEVYVQPYSSFVPLSLQQCCTNLWFGSRVRTSTRILVRCINAYKLKLPWLKDTIKETLDRSPFNNYQELANFINSHVIKSRNFIRIGPGVFSKRLTGQLFQLIRKSQREGYVLKSGTPGRKEYQGSAEVVSKLSLALSLPTQKMRESQVKRVLTTSPKIYDNVNNIQKMSKRDANLSYIQAFIKGDMTIDDISSSIQQTGLGLIFSYSKMQEKIETSSGTKWVGKGQCCVFTEQSLILVDMKDDYCTGIEVSNWKHMKSHQSTMSSILRELKLKVIHESTVITSRKLVAKFDGMNWLPPSMIGTPVYESTYLTPRYRDVENVILDIGFQSLSLSQMTPRGKLSMIRFKTYPGDVLLNPSRSVGADLIDAWLNQRCLNPETAIALILSLSRGKVKNQQLQEWLIETLKARLAQKGLSRGPGVLSQWIPTLELESQERDLSLTDDQITQLGMEIFAQEDLIFGLTPEQIAKEWVLHDVEEPEGKDFDEDVDETELLASDWTSVFHNWKNIEIEENIDITSKGVKSFKYLHVLWDKMIDEVENSYSNFWQDTFSGVINEGFPELSEALIKIAKVKPKKRPLGLRERAELKITEIISQIAEEEVAGPSASTQVRRDDESSWVELAEEEDEFSMFDVI